MRTPATLAMALCVVAAPACRPEEPPAVEGKADEAKAHDAGATPSKAGDDAKAGDATPSAPGVLAELEDAKRMTACTELKMLRGAVEMFTAMKGACPPDLPTLESERMIAKLRDDPWGHAYRLRCSELELRSAGPDGEPATPDDVVLGATGDACTSK